MGLAQKIEQRYRGLDSPAKMKLATAGCPRNCSEAMVKDLGLVAIGDDKWEVYVGGAAGAHIRKGDVLCTVTGEEEALRISDRFFQYYRENAKWKERTYTFMKRMGLAKLKSILVDDSEGICADLDAAMLTARGAVRDPWLERDKEAVPNQFASRIAEKV
jgi:nitrite reductase (NADH) large subunit